MKLSQLHGRETCCEVVSNSKHALNSELYKSDTPKIIFITDLKESLTSLMPSLYKVDELASSNVSITIFPKTVKQ